VTDQLLHAASTATYRAALDGAASTLSRALCRARGPVTPPDRSSATAEVGAIDLDTPLASFEDALAEVDRLYLEHAVWFHDERYVAHLNCPVAIPAVAAEVLVSGVNSSLDTWDQSTVGTLIERRLIEWTAERIGFGPAADGVFTSGGTQSNLQALLLARGEVCARLTGAEGLDDLPPEVLPRLRVLATAESHFSVRKAAGVLGLGGRAVVTVPTDASGRMDPEALDLALLELDVDGLVPMAVVTTAGTTDRGIVDPLAEIAEVCGRHDVWLHVDAAVGGGLLASTRERHRLDGIGSADSVTIDYHKTWFQPVSSSALIVRDGRSLRHVTVYADYLNPHDAGVPNQVDRSMQTTRRFDALKLWLTLRASGADEVGRWVDACLDSARTAHDAARRTPGLETFEEPQLMMLLFRHRPVGLDDQATDDHNRRIRARLFAEGSASIAETVVAGRRWLKLTLLNPMTSPDALEGVLRDVAATGEALAAEGAEGAEGFQGKDEQVEVMA
jgi:L-2,4-diaminobutyrate decarboxylase